MAQGNRNQHWVPQFYLKRFATPESRDTEHPQIWSYPIEEGEEFLTRVRNVAAKRDLYSLCEPDVDAKLTDYENFMGAHWSKFADANYPLSDPFKKGIGLFISMLFLRNPRELDRHRKHAQMWKDAVQSLPRDADGNLTISSVLIGDNTVPVTPAEIESLADQSEEGIKKSWGGVILYQTGMLAKHLIEQPWSMVVADEPMFITTDHPVVLTHHEMRNPGFLAPGVRYFLPISPTRLLIVGEPRMKDGHHYPIKPGGGAHYNYLILRSAYRFAFCPWDPIKLLREVVSVGERYEQEKAVKRRVEDRKMMGKIGRNEPCPCGSGKKFKRCCLLWRP